MQKMGQDCSEFFQKAGQETMKLQGSRFWLDLRGKICCKNCSLQLFKQRLIYFLHLLPTFTFCVNTEECIFRLHQKESNFTENDNYTMLLIGNKSLFSFLDQ